VNIHSSKVFYTCNIFPKHVNYVLGTYVLSLTSCFQILLGRGLIEQVKWFRSLLHFYWLLIAPRVRWINIFWLV